MIFDFGPDGRVVERVEGAVFAFTWGDDVLRWEVRADGDGSVLTLTHEFGDRYGAASFAAGWHTCVAALVVLLAGGRARTPGDMAGTHEAFVAILGLDPVTEQGSVLRLERQLTRPAEEVWRRLDGEQAVVGAAVPSGFAPEGAGRPVSRVEAGKLVEFGPVRWELGEGTGQGPRLIVTHEGGSALAGAWRAYVENLAADLV